MGSDLGPQSQARWRVDTPRKKCWEASVARVAGLEAMDRRATEGEPVRWLGTSVEHLGNVCHN